MADTKSNKRPEGLEEKESFPLAKNDNPFGKSGPSNGEDFSSPGDNPLQSQSFLAAPSLPTQPPISQKLRDQLEEIRTRKYGAVGPLQYGLTGGFGLAGILNPNQPLFARYYIPAMERDPHISYGVEMLEGPIITKAKYEVVSKYPEVIEYGQRQLDRFQISGLSEALTCMKWGFCGHEVLYQWNEEEKCVDYHGLNYIHPYHAQPVLDDGYFIGMEVTGEGLEKPRYLPVPKCVWFTHDKRYHRWWGRSVLEGAFIPWYETWQPKGFRAIRHLWLYKNAFDSGVIRYPEGGQVDAATGVVTPNVLVAQQLADQKESGATLILPSLMSADMVGSWDYLPPVPPGVPEGLFTYGDSLKEEKWEGLGVPPEVAKTEDTGSFAGRRVPQQAFYSSLQKKANYIYLDGFDPFILQFLIRLKFGPKVQYSLKPISILQTLQEEEMGVVTGSLPGDEEEESGFPEDDIDNEDEEDENPGKESELSNGRIEDRGSNAFNLKEKGIKNRKKKKGKK